MKWHICIKPAEQVFQPFFVAIMNTELSRNNDAA